MATFLRAPTKTFEAAEAIAKNLRVKLNSDGTIEVATAAENDIGTAERTAVAAGDDIAVNLASLEGTGVYVASATIAAGAEVYGSAAGKISTTNTGSPIGIALTGGGADDEIEVLRRQI